MKYKFINKVKKCIIPIIIIIIVFVGGLFVGDKITYKPIVYTKYYTDTKTGVQYLVIASKHGGVAVYPRLGSDGALYVKRKIIFVSTDIKEKFNEQTNFDSNQ